MAELMDYRALTIEAARRYGVPEDIALRLVGQESGFNPTALSPKGALGLGQLMPGTAAELGVDPSDPIQNIDGSMRYFKQQLDTFGSVPLALAAYNAGPGAVRKYGGIPPYKETQNYVATIMGGGGGSAGGGNSGSRVTASTRGGAMPAGLLAMDEEPQTFGQRLKRDFKSGDLMDRIALAANSLTMNPDPVFAQTIQARQQQRADKATSNRTAQWLMTQGRTDLAEALMTGAIDPKTAVATAMTPVPPPADNRTAMMLNYEYWLSRGKTPAEAQALVTASGGGSTTNINMADESQGALNKEFAKAEGVSLAAAMAQGPRASSALQDLTLLGEVLQYAPQDPVTGRLAELIPGVSSAGAAAQSIIKRVAPTLRAEGSGATSDIEYNGMLQSLPSLQNYPEANAAILGMMKAKAAIDIERSRVVRDFANSGQTAQDAQAMRSRLAEIDSRSIMTPDLQRVIGALSGVPAAAETSTGTGTTPAVPSGARTFNPQTGRLE